MRPVPREPSKQLKPNSLPATKRRAISAFMGSASAGKAASRVTTTIANRAIITDPPSSTAFVRSDNCLLTMRIGHDHAQPWSPNPLPNLDHDSATYPPLDNVAPRLDHLGQRDLGRQSASLPRSSSPARRCYASCRSAIGRMTESIPMIETPRKIKGATDVGKSIPPANPHAATAPP